MDKETDEEWFKTAKLRYPLKHRPFLKRLWLSYHGFRCFGLGRLEALRWAWRVAR